jgi:hypothetical protein
MLRHSHVIEGHKMFNYVSKNSKRSFLLLLMKEFTMKLLIIASCIESTQEINLNAPTVVDVATPNMHEKKIQIQLS